MSEKLDLSEQPIDESNETKSPADRYEQLDIMRQSYEQDGELVFNNLTAAFSDGLNEPHSPIDQVEIDKLKTYLELDEQSLAGVEREMAIAESEMGYSPDQSKRFNNCKTDVMVGSAVFYHDRVKALRDIIDDQDIDKEFVQSVVDYAEAIEHDEKSVSFMVYDDLADRQEYMADCQRRRSIRHNHMIDELNKLNDLAREHGVKPLVYRNLIKNSATNQYRNNQQMHHDRVTAAHYVSTVIQLEHDGRFPDPKYVEET